MKLVFVRHATAEGHSLDDADLDFQRELTPKGEKRFRAAIRKLRPALPAPDVVFCSPLFRAVQTAEIISEVWPDADLELITDLQKLEDPMHLVEYISFLPTEGTYFFVGHEPHFSSVIAALLGLHPEHDFMGFKKGGVCVLEGGIWEGLMMKLLVSPQFLEDLSP